METVILKLPLKSEYVMIARLAASGYCARLGLDIDITEDIKVSISEVINKCIVKKNPDDVGIMISFDADDKYFMITFAMAEIKNKMQPEDEMDLGISIINALCSQLMFSGENELIIKFKLGETA